MLEHDPDTALRGEPDAVTGGPALPSRWRGCAAEGRPV